MCVLVQEEEVVADGGGVMVAVMVDLEVRVHYSKYIFFCFSSYFTHHRVMVPTLTFEDCFNYNFSPFIYVDRPSH